MPRFSPGLSAALPWLLGAAAWAGAMLRAWPPSAPASLSAYSLSGTALIAGLPHGDITYNMPLFGVVMSAFAGAGGGYLYLAGAVQAAVCLLVFSAGRMAGGRAAGTLALALLAAAENSVAGYDLEQSFYSLTLLLALCALLEKGRRPSAGTAAAAGLALGFSMLVRVPLFLFPPVLVLAEAAAGPRGRGLVLRSAVFLAASYALLLPWGFLNLSAEGRFSLVNRQSAADNVITGAMGAVYSLEGDSRRAGGLPPGESAEAFFVRTVVSDPASYAVSVMRRLLHIFLFHPVLIALFCAALLLNRERALRPALLLPVYFVLMHAAFSIEKRYFFPLTYMLPPLAAAALLARARLSPGPEGPCRATRALFIGVLAASAAALALAVSWPARSAAMTPARAAGLFPSDPVLRKNECAGTLRRWGHGAYIACLEHLSADLREEGTACALSAARGGRPPRLPEGHEGRLYCLSAGLLRAAGLGDYGRAREILKEAMHVFYDCCAKLRGEPYDRDREIAARIREQSDLFWRVYAAEALRLWPPADGRRLAGRVSEELGAPGDLFSAPDGAERIPLGDERSAKDLSDRAVERIVSGDLRGGEKLIELARAEDPSSPEALMTLCRLRGLRGRHAEAAEFCGLAFCSVKGVPSRHTPGLLGLAAAAAEGRRIALISAGREREAAAFAKAAGGASPAAACAGLDFFRPAR